VYVSKFDVFARADESTPNVLIEFTVRVHKTHAIQTYVAHARYDGTRRPVDVAQTAWNELTGLCPTETGKVDRDISPSQQATLDNIKHFVCTETAKPDTRLPMVVV
jgi:hypothetical protein